MRGRVALLLSLLCVAQALPLLLNDKEDVPLSRNKRNAKLTNMADKEVRTIISAIVDAILDGDKKKRSEILDDDIENEYSNHDEDESPQNVKNLSNGQNDTNIKSDDVENSGSGFISGSGSGSSSGEWSEVSGSGEADEQFTNNTVERDDDNSVDDSSSSGQDENSGSNVSNNSETISPKVEKNLITSSTKNIPYFESARTKRDEEGQTLLSNYKQNNARLGNATVKTEIQTITAPVKDSKQNDLYYKLKNSVESADIDFDTAKVDLSSSSESSSGELNDESSSGSAESNHEMGTDQESSDEQGMYNNRIAKRNYIADEDDYDENNNDDNGFHADTSAKSTNSGNVGVVNVNHNLKVTSVLNGGQPNKSDTSEEVAAQSPLSSSGDDDEDDEDVSSTDGSASGMETDKRLIQSNGEAVFSSADGATLSEENAEDFGGTGNISQYGITKGNNHNTDKTKSTATGIQHRQHNLIQENDETDGETNDESFGEGSADHSGENGSSGEMDNDDNKNKTQIINQIVSDMAEAAVDSVADGNGDDGDDGDDNVEASGRVVKKSVILRSDEVEKFSGNRNEDDIVMTSSGDSTSASDKPLFHSQLHRNNTVLPSVEKQQMDKALKGLIRSILDKDLDVKEKFNKLKMRRAEEEEKLERDILDLVNKTSEEGDKPDVVGDQLKGKVVSEVKDFEGLVGALVDGPYLEPWKHEMIVKKLENDLLHHLSIPEDDEGLLKNQENELVKISDMEYIKDKIKEVEENTSIFAQQHSDNLQAVKQVAVSSLTPIIESLPLRRADINELEDAINKSAWLRMMENSKRNPHSRKIKNGFKRLTFT